MSEAPTWRTAARPSSRTFFMLLLAGIAVASFFLLRPYGALLLFAAVLASSTHRPYEKLVALLRGRRMLAATIFATAFVLMVLVPLLTAIAASAGDVMRAAESLSKQLSESGGLEGVLTRLPGPLARAVRALDLDAQSIAAQLGTTMERVLTTTGTVMRISGEALVDLALLTIALVVFLVEGPRIVRWLDDVVPLEPGQTFEIREEFRKVGASVLIGNFGTGFVQAGVALVGYLIAGVPSAMVFTLLTFVFSLVPSIGAGGVGLVAAAVVALMGKTGMAIFLALYSVCVVGVVDNVAKPMLVKRGLDLHGALVFFAIVSGLAAFGVSGMLLGPVIVAFAVTLVRIYERDFRGGRKASNQVVEVVLPTVPPIARAPRAG
jgi:predicted PurR-regulated permease PerM